MQMSSVPICLKSNKVSLGAQLTISYIVLSWASLIAQLAKTLTAMEETQVGSLGWEDPQEKEMATHSSSLAWEIPWTEEPGGLQYIGSQELDTT